MAPKIEEISPNKEDAKPKKNPFESQKKKTTIRREAKDVYGSKEPRKGLHTPQYQSKSAIDVLFSEIEEKLNGSVEDFTLNILYERIIGHGITESGNEEFLKRYKVTEKMFEYLIQIQQLSEANIRNLDDKNLIKISLHDIKTFSKLVNLIIEYGIYPALNTFRIGVPFEKRLLNDFSKNKKPRIIEKLPNLTEASKKYEYHEKLLTLVYSKFMKVFSVDSDVKDLLIKGTGFSDFLTVAITLITSPYFSEDKKPVYLTEYDNTISAIPETYELFQTYTLLLTTPSPSFFKQFVMARLQTLHYDAPKRDGLLTLVEFVLGLRENDEVNVEKFDHVANVVLTKPKSINTVDYFTNIGLQCYDLLVLINRPVVTSCIGYVLEKLWNKNKSVVRDFILKIIWQKFNPEDSHGSEILVSEAQLNNNINVLISLTKKGLSSDLLSALFNPILLPVWSYYVFLRKHSKSAEVIMSILVGYFTVMKDLSKLDDDIFGLDSIAKNILFDEGETWKYQMGKNGLVEIVRKNQEFVTNSDSKDNKINKFLGNLDSNCEYFTDFLKDIDDDLILKLFINILKRWFKINNLSSTLGNDVDENPFFMLVDLRLLENIGSKFKESLAKTPFEMLEIVKNILMLQGKGKQENNKVKNIDLVVDTADSDDEDSDDEEDFDQDNELLQQSFPVVLELLSAILSESSATDLDEACHKLLKEIVKLLERVNENPSNISQSAVNGSKSLHDRIKLLLEGEKPPISTKDLHSKTLARAITSLNDPLVPIRAHGLYLLRQLVESKSEVISLDFVINLHLIQLKDPEPFIYLNVIKGLQSLIEWNETEVLRILTSIYVNEKNDNDLDERLKIGEVLLRYIESSNELFSGESAEIIADSMLHLIRRPLNDSDKEDDRLRMSAMSLLGTCCKVNPIGIIGNLDDALSCAIGILQLETDKDSAIMRRCAVVLIHDLIIGTSNSERVEFPKEYREKVSNTLKYILETDNDLLAREQAQIVLDTIDELVQLAISLLETDDNYKHLKIT
ncbi:uncharacterized protein AC631_02633 [Debaryomyces fabryi]|uniref:RNA polymerase II assembly factor Rtp1 C-terminal domain-containing protein n=1 Tax=Debaryomyces fabryi TaxID=58627 RepID=A0A0V1PZB5_9ASCO|nr:uncharacterized protein AC631_02633 [Debaryomyces fabryi]KSA01624.1 hypothetical protein AC631_02633 [Debaryomyces fabryi]CUM47176.1 unnamed protein product [Debaryomyces fabryi]